MVLRMVATDQEWGRVSHQSHAWLLNSFRFGLHGQQRIHICSKDNFRWITTLNDSQCWINVHRVGREKKKSIKIITKSLKSHLPWDSESWKFPLTHQE